MYVCARMCMYVPFVAVVVVVADATHRHKHMDVHDHMNTHTRVLSIHKRGRRHSGCIIS